MVELRVFGLLDLRDDHGAELRPVLTQPKRAALLAYLALSRPRLFVRRDKLLALFWPDLDAPHARDALNQALRFLRRELGDELLVSRGGEEIGLAAERLSCDCWTFETQIDAGQLDEALALYRGDLLEAFHADASTEFDSWLESERTRLRALARSAASRLSADVEAAGELSAAIGWSRRALMIDPLDEQSLRRLVQLLDRSGDRAAAVRAYQEFAGRLNRELDLEPAPETRALIESVRQRAEILLHADAHDEAPEPGRGPRSRMVRDANDAVQVSDQSRWRKIRQRAYSRPLIVAGGASLVLILAVAGLAWRKQSRLNWLRTVALPQSAQLIEKGQFFPAVRLLRRAEALAPNQGLVRDLLMESTMLVDVRTDPSGAAVYVRDFFDPKDQWQYLGRTPLDNLRLPPGKLVWRFKLQGHVVAENLRWQPRRVVNFSLHRESDAPAGMVHIPAAEIQLLNDGPPVALSDFWIDRLEVTNREFKRFVDQGGYTRTRLWKESLAEGGLPWERAQQLFRDTTGHAGPANWRSGNYPQGQGEHPVGGVSWYEAAVYCASIGKQLPTAYHWFRAADFATTLQLARFGNFGAKGSVPGAQPLAFGSFGTYNMAGNVKEWAWNRGGVKERYILGGGWNEPDYMYIEPDARDPVERLPTHGIRCAKYPKPPSATLLAPMLYPRRDVRRERPVGDALFATYYSLFDYDRLALNARTESVDSSAAHWRVERVSFDAAYGNERVPALLFLPKTATPPYQTVLYHPGAGAFAGKFNFDDGVGQRQWFLFLVRSGRAVVVPMYKGTFERFERPIGPPHAFRDFTIFAAKDLRRTIDYLETRPDIDMRKLAYYGLSNGASLGPIMTAIEPRFRTSVLVAGGLTALPRLPEVEPLNYLPRVTLPTLMVNGQYDFFFPFETSQRPFFRALGTPNEDKRHVLLNAGHVSHEWNDVTRPVLEWLDSYLGPVDQTTAWDFRMWDLRKR